MGGVGLPKRLLLQVFALSAAQRLKRYAEPCGWLVPARVTIVTAPPFEWPNDASNMVVFTLTSSTESTDGTYTTDPLESGTVSGTPSRITSLLPCVAPPPEMLNC